MLSFFPTLYGLEMIVPLFFRLIVATVLLFQMWCLISETEHSTVHKVLHDIFREDWRDAMRVLIATFRLVAAILLILGFLTQIGALIAVILFALRMASHTYRTELMSTDLLLLIISLSLLFLGPGAFAIDYPF